LDDDCEQRGAADSVNDREASGTGDPMSDHNPAPGLAKAIQRIGVAVDHGGFELARRLIVRLRALGYLRARRGSYLHLKPNHAIKI
jgi:hypothetical protein